MVDQVKSFEEMSEEELDQAGATVHAAILELKEQKRQIQKVRDDRASKERLGKVLESLTPEEREALKLSLANE